MSQDILVNFYRAVIESILCFSIIVWYGSITTTQKRQLNRVVKTAARIIGCKLLSLDDIYVDRVRRRSKKIIEDSTHPANAFFELLPSGRRYRAAKCRTARKSNSFFPRAITILNNQGINLYSYQDLYSTGQHVCNVWVNCSIFIYTSICLFVLFHARIHPNFNFVFMQNMTNKDNNNFKQK